MSAYEKFSVEISSIKIKLIYKYILSGKQLVIEMTDLRGSHAKGRIPAYYQYLEPVAGRPYAIFKLIAGPGVNITLNGFPSNPYQPNPFYPLVEIIRVQDSDLVPTIGTDFNTHQLLGEYLINPPKKPEGKDIGNLIKWFEYSRFSSNFFTISPINRGLVIRHHQSLQDLIITVPTHTGDYEFIPFLAKTDKIHSEAKFCFQVNENGSTFAKRSNKSINLPILEIVKTPAVKVELARGPIQYSFDNVLLGGKKTSLDTIFFEIYETDKIGNVPNQGEHFNSLKSYWNRVSIKDIEVTQPIILSPELAVLDAAVRFVPVLGDIIDIAEFGQGLFSGRDLFGRKLSNTEVAILGISALLPFTVSGAAKSVSLLRRTFGRRAAKAADLLRKMKKAGVNAEDAKIIKESEKRIKKGLPLKPEQVQQISTLYQRIHSEPLTIDELLNVDKTGFMHAELQEGYRTYAKNRTDPASPRDWAMGKTRNPKAIALLKGFLGDDYIKRARKLPEQPKQYLNNFEVPRPTDLSHDEAVRFLNECFAKPRQLTERLKDLFPSKFTGIRPDSVLNSFPFRTPTVSQGLFNILKGNLAEILSKKIKLRHLDEIRKTYPSAKLISGLKMQLKVNGKYKQAKLFADDIIAMVDNDNLKILMLYEVKAGYRGGSEATQQIFDWIEGRLTHAEGSRLILPNGKTFIYDPSSTAKGRVLGLNNAPRTIITAKGASHLGVDSSMQVAARTKRVELEITSKQIEDKLHKEFLQEYLEEVARKKRLKEYTDEFMDSLESKRARVDFTNEYFDVLASKKKGDIQLDIIPIPKVEYLDDIKSAQMDFLVSEILGKLTIK